MMESMPLLNQSLKEVLSGNICNQDGILCVSEDMILEWLKDSASSSLEIAIIEEGIKFNRIYGNLGIFILGFMLELLNRCPYSSWFKAVRALNSSKMNIEKELKSNLTKQNFTAISLIIDILSQSLNKLRPFTNKRNLCLIILECFLKTINCSTDNLPYLSNRVSYIRINSSSLIPIFQYDGLLFEIPNNFKIKNQVYHTVLYTESILPESFTNSDKNTSLITNIDDFPSIFSSIVKMHTDLEVNLVLCQKLIPHKLKIMFHDNGIACIERISAINVPFIKRISKSNGISSIVSLSTESLFYIDIETIQICDKYFILFKGSDTVSLVIKTVSDLDEIEIKESFKSCFKVLINSDFSVFNKRKNNFKHIESNRCRFMSGFCF